MSTAMKRELPKGARIHRGRIEVVAKYRGTRTYQRFSLGTSPAEIVAWQRTAVDALRGLRSNAPKMARAILKDSAFRAELYALVLQAVERGGAQ